MKFIIHTTTFFGILFLILGNTECLAQRGYADDSIQIKIYSEIKYDRYRATQIRITKVFCDYCNEKQINHLKRIGWEAAYSERHLPKNILEKGIKRLAIYVRLPKDKFRSLKDE